MVGECEVCVSESRTYTDCRWTLMCKGQCGWMGWLDGWGVWLSTQGLGLAEGRMAENERESECASADGCRRGERVEELWQGTSVMAYSFPFLNHTNTKVWRVVWGGGLGNANFLQDFKIQWSG